MLGPGHWGDVIITEAPDYLQGETRELFEEVTVSKRTLEDVIGDRYWVMTGEDVKCLRDAGREIERLRGIERALLSLWCDEANPMAHAVAWYRYMAANVGGKDLRAQRAAIADALEAK